MCSPSAPARATPSSGTSSTPSPASSPSAPSSSSTSSPTSRPSTAPLAYAQQVKFLNSLPLVRVLEWAFIFIPLAFHALYGLFIAFRGRVSVNVYPWASNWMYVSQRITGIIAFLYIVQHVWRQRFSGISLPENPGAAFHKVQVELSNPWMLAIYVIAMIATTWHFAYGIWLFAAKWGITPGEKARKKFGYVCTAFGLALCLMGLASIYAVVWKYPNAPANRNARPTRRHRLTRPNSHTTKLYKPRPTWSCEVTSAEQVQIGAAVIGVLGLLLILVFRFIVSFHINNEIIRQARGPDRPGRPETRQEAMEALSTYVRENPSSNLRKAQRTLVWSSTFVWITLIALLFIVWDIMANR